MKLDLIKTLPNKQFFRPDEVAILFRVNVRTIRRWAANKKIHYVRTPGRAIRVPRVEIIGY
jgi:excisionase family DNA binding protein